MPAITIKLAVDTSEITVSINNGSYYTIRG